MEISIAPHTLFTIGSFAFTNSMATAVLVTLICIIFAVFTKKSFRLIPSKLQIVVELGATFVLDQLANACQSQQKAKQIFPLLMTLLFFILIANQLTVLPFLGQLIYDGKPLFRTVTSDVSQTLALGVLTVLTGHAIAFKMSPLKHIGNFIKVEGLFKARSAGEFGNALLDLFLGFLDIIGEIAKVMSLSFRLFGNVLAGELIIAIIGGLSLFTSVFVPIPFMVLSIFSGVVQAVVFAMLAVQFLSANINSVAGEELEEELANNPNTEILSPVS